MHTIKPLDEAAVLEAAARSGRLISTVEEHSVIGGLGGAVVELLVTSSGPPGCRFTGTGSANTYSLIGPPTHLYPPLRARRRAVSPTPRAPL